MVRKINGPPSPFLPFRHDNPRIVFTTINEAQLPVCRITPEEFQRFPCDLRLHFPSVVVQPDIRFPGACRSSLRGTYLACERFDTLDFPECQPLRATSECHPGQPGR